LPYYIIAGYSLDELGFVMEMDVDTAMKLGRKRLQDAIYCV